MPWLNIQPSQARACVCVCVCVCVCIYIYIYIYIFINSSYCKMKVFAALSKEINSVVCQAYLLDVYNPLTQILLSFPWGSIPCWDMQNLALVFMEVNSVFCQAYLLEVYNTLAQILLSFPWGSILCWEEKFGLSLHGDQFRTLTNLSPRCLYSPLTNFSFVSMDVSSVERYEKFCLSFHGDRFRTLTSLLPRCL